MKLFAITFVAFLATAAAQNDENDEFIKVFEDQADCMSPKIADSFNLFDSIPGFEILEADCNTGTITDCEGVSVKAFKLNFAPGDNKIEVTSATVITFPLGINVKGNFNIKGSKDVDVTLKTTGTPTNTENHPVKISYNVKFYFDFKKSLENKKIVLTIDETTNEYEVDATDFLANKDEIEKLIKPKLESKINLTALKDELEKTTKSFESKASKTEISVAADWATAIKNANDACPGTNLWKKA